MIKKILRVYLLIAIFHSFFCANTLGFTKSENQDSSKNLWGIQLGYFPNYNNSFSSDGLSLFLLSENYFLKDINHGYFFTYQRAFYKKINTNIPNDSFALGTYFNYKFYLNSNSLIISGGIGLGYPTVAINFLNILMVEYCIPINDTTAISFSLLQEIVRLNFFLPIQINLGVRF